MGFWLLRSFAGEGAGQPRTNAGRGSGGGEGGEGKPEEGEPSIFTPPPSPAGRGKTMVFMNTHIFVKRRTKCKNVGTVWSLAEGRGSIGEPGSIRRGWF